MFVNTKQIGQFGICRLNWNDIGDPCVRPTTIQVSKAIQVAQIRWLSQTVSLIPIFQSLVAMLRPDFLRTVRDSDSNSQAVDAKFIVWNNAML